MFEITPFTSFNELIDLEDFIVSHTKLGKYKKLFVRFILLEQYFRKLDKNKISTKL